MIVDLESQSLWARNGKSQALTTSGTLSEDGSEPSRAPDGLAPIVFLENFQHGDRSSNGPKIQWKMIPSSLKDF